jgi:hypothetical protein
MSFDRELLWKAWPNGYLAMSGVHTVGGWICLGEDDEGPKWSHPDPRVRADPPPQWTRCFDGELKAGDLLPNVDPADTATWACLLADLAQAWNCTEPQNHKNVPRTLSLQGGLAWYSMEPGCWVLTDGRTSAGFGRDATACEYLAHFTSVQMETGIDTDDPALALVLARIQVREEAP